jgi:hypothetical protein
LKKRKRVRTRKDKTVFLDILDENGNRVPLTPKMSNWYQLYVNEPDITNKKFHLKFRRRFRVPFEQYQELLAEATNCELFKRWTRKDAAGKDSSPLALLVLGGLRYLGRGWTFDDLEESTAIDEETHRQFFHKFIEFGSTVLFERHVQIPTTTEEAKEHMHEFAEAGFAGCVGSMDATHILLEQCSNRLRQNHTSSKLKAAARTYNITVNHRRRILHMTSGYPS